MVRCTLVDCTQYLSFFCCDGELFTQLGQQSAPSLCNVGVIEISDTWIRARKSQQLPYLLETENEWYSGRSMAMGLSDTTNTSEHTNSWYRRTNWFSAADCGQHMRI